MSLTSIQLCTIDPVDRAAGKFQVTVHSDDGKQLAIFDCSSEPDALRLRTAIREHADQLRRVADYRDRQAEREQSAGGMEPLRALELILLSLKFEQRMYGECDPKRSTIDFPRAIEMAERAIAQATRSAA